ncbi:MULTISPECIES: phage portal protein [Clostridium]|uniref:phage portal protein n=1 Tax=Clostridium TaxID=1485 RepID=UPI0004B4C9F1|nr:phage portal protein [Clostridium saudiense]
MAWWRKKKEVRTEETTLEDLLLQAKLGEDRVTKEMALNIPTLAGCLELVSNTIATLPIQLFKEENGKVTQVLDDNRVKLLNDDTRDTLDGFQFKKALVDDYLLMGNGYAYINKNRGKIESLHYVKESDVSINKNVDPIFKSYDILVGGETYYPHNFIKILRNTKDGATGTGIIESSNKLLTATYNSLVYENILAKTGGNKKGFIKSESSKLTDDAIRELKDQWGKMYSGNSENCIVLNKGLSFQESGSTSTEMQLNENKKANGIEICKILNVPPSMIEGDGKANESDYEKFVKMAILPILRAILSSLNRDLLLEKEKKSFYFAFDIKELLKGDIEKRFKAYEIGIKNGFLSINEVRYEEDREPIKAFEDIIKLGLQDVLFNTKDNTIYTPNTDKTSKITDLKGGEKDEDRSKE